MLVIAKLGLIRLHEVKTEQPADAVRGSRMEVGRQVGELVREPEAARIPVREHRIKQAHQVVLGISAPAIGVRPARGGVEIILRREHSIVRSAKIFAVLRNNTQPPQRIDQLYRLLNCNGSS